MEQQVEKIFKFCPKCGSACFGKKGNGFSCEECQFRFYINPAAAVAALIINKKGEVLLSKRGRDPFKGKYDLPGGFVDLHERAEDAVIREINEELNLKITQIDFLASFPNTYEYKGMTYYPLDIGFVCRVKSLSKIQAQDDVAGFEFRDPAKLDLSSIAFESVRKLLNAYCEKIGRRGDHLD